MLHCTDDPDDGGMSGFTGPEPMRHVYSLLLYLLTPALLVYFLVRGLGDRDWLRRWRERFALGGKRAAAGDVRGFVVHAVSVGEVNAAEPLIRALMRRWPDQPVTVTCFTPTGSRRVRALFGDTVHHRYAPIDWPGVVGRFLAATRPRMLVVMETEIWPNLFTRARKNGIPLLISNARLTERSLRGWGRFGGLAEAALDAVSLIAAQSGEDARRFVTLGADPERTRAVGNLKFDLALPEDLPEQAAALREQWGEKRSVLVAGSTHEGDERPLLEAFRGVIDKHPDALLALAPRYPERFARVAEHASQAGFTVCRLSDARGPDGETQVLVIDRMGELLPYYAAADLAFVGGTLAAVGGHNPLEPAALGKPLLFGPNTAHIEETATRLKHRGAAIEVGDAKALERAWEALMADEERRRRMGEAAKTLVENEQGALKRTLQIVEHLLFDPSGERSALATREAD